MLLLLTIVTLFLAYANGANDNFKGVASIYGSGTASYRTSLTWATVAQVAGSLASVYLADTLLKQFSGKGIVPDEIAGSLPFVLSVGLGAGLTVILATVTGFPISTTHGLTGAIIGGGAMAVGAAVNVGGLGKAFVLPLLLSPFLAVAISAALYIVLRYARLRLGVTKEWCVCAGERQELVPVSQPASVLRFEATAVPIALPTIQTGTVDNCTLRYGGRLVGVSSQRIVDAVHFTSGGAVCFARGLNDTPKVAALLLVGHTLGVKGALVGVTVAMALGGMLNARRVAETMSRRITTLNTGQGLAANLATAALVIAASLFGLPVSTTHVSVGALFGIGMTARTADVSVVRNVLLSWLVTLPCAALIAALAYALLTR
jgi:inorganic phosphate transporter, PiT family